jgi:hypothetical protein
MGGAWKTCSQCDAYAAEGGIVEVLGMLCKVLHDHGFELRLRD